MSPKIFLFDTESSHLNLLPLSFLRPVAALRVGIFTIREKWQRFLGAPCYYLPVGYLRCKFGNMPKEDENVIMINGSVLPDDNICDYINRLADGEILMYKDDVIAFKGRCGDFFADDHNNTDNNREKKVEININIKKVLKYEGDLKIIKYVFDIFTNNKEQIKRDFKEITNGRQSCSIKSPYVSIIGDLTDEEGNPNLFIEEGAEIDAATINLRKGPVYIGKDVVIMEGSHLRGPLAICHNSKIKMGAKIYGGCTFGPYTKVGGEINNTVILGFSNKAHDGYLGDAVIGEWCNIGAGVNASNLKNDYSRIRVWNYATQSFMKTDLQFCGLIMGDHSKIGVNCMLNTATVIGIGVNLHGSGFPRVFLPNFCEGSPAAGFKTTSLKKFHEIAGRAMSRRSLLMDENDRKIISHLYEQTSAID